MSPKTQTNPLNLGNTSLGRQGFDGVMAGAGGESCEVVGGGKVSRGIIEGGTPPLVAVDTTNSSITCLQLITFATTASDSSISCSKASNSQRSNFIHFL